MYEKLRVIAWIAIALLVLGQGLPWSYHTRPPSEVWDLMFSRVSRPNPEWWIWCLAPSIAALLAARDIVRQQKVSVSVLVPIGIFLLTWVALFVIGNRRYGRIFLHYTGFVATLIGMAALAAVAVLGTREKKIAPYARSQRRSTRV